MMEQKQRLATISIVLAFIFGCVFYQQQNGTSMLERKLARKLSTIPADFQTQFPDALTQKLTEKVMGYWHSCTSTIDPSITIEYELNPLNGLDAAVATVVPDDDPLKKYAVIVFRGSDELADWFINLDYQLTDAAYGPPGTQVFGGYYETISSRFGKKLESQAMKLLSDDSYEDTLFIIGYSAGAGFTNAFAPYIADKYPLLPVKAILWAPPRGGNDVWRDFVNSLSNLNFWRYVHENDPVPRLPLNVMSFYHAGHLIDINENDAKAYYQQIGNEVYAGVPRTWNTELDLTGGDHAFVNYCGYYTEDYLEPTEFELSV